MLPKHARPRLVLFIKAQDFLSFSGNLADVEKAEFGSARRAGRAIPHPRLRQAVVLPADEPFAHAIQAPHGTAVALDALPVRDVVTALLQFHIGCGLHAADTGLQFLQHGNIIVIHLHTDIIAHINYGMSM